MDHQRSIDVLELGNGGHLAVVVDGFSRAPERWRAEAAQAEYRELGDYYPGRRSPVPQAYLEETGPLLGAIFRNVFGCESRMTVQRALYSIVSRPPAELELAQRIPHIDSAEPGHFAMVHFLSHEDWGGTAFYRHRETGCEAITPDRHRDYLDRLQAEFDRTGVPAPGYISGDTPQFERIGSVEHRFNRAVIYPSNLLHCSATRNDRTYFEDPLEGRLTIAAFMLAR